MKILYTASVLSHICQFHLPMMKLLQQHGWEVHVAARDNLAEKNGLKLEYCDKYTEIPFQRSPKDKRNIRAFKMLRELINNEFYDVILCNTPVCSIITRIAARKTRKNGTKVVYMAHGFHFYSGCPKKMWAIYPIEKFFADHDTDLIITINKEDFERAKENFNCKVDHMYGVGVRSDRFHPVTMDEQHIMRIEEGLIDEDFVVLCTGELLPNKNQKTLIEAVNLCRDRVPNIKLLLAGNGPERDNLEILIETLNLQDRIKLLGYRTDLEKVVPCVDVVASVSIREGLGLNVIEGMLCAKPIIASHNRGHEELVQEGITGVLCSSDDVRGLAEALYSFSLDRQKITSMGKSGYEYVQRYVSDNVNKQFGHILKELLSK